eukprot:4888374-Pleurochrysis_carterae.AAC.1
MVGVVFLIVMRGVRRYDCVAVGPFERCGWRLRVRKRGSYGNRDRQLVAFVGRLSVRKRQVNGPERSNGFRDV